MTVTSQSCCLFYYLHFNQDSCIIKLLEVRCVSVHLDFFFFEFSSVPVAIGVCVFVWSGSCCRNCWTTGVLTVESSDPDLGDQE